MGCIGLHEEDWAGEGLIRNRNEYNLIALHPGHPFSLKQVFLVHIYVHRTLGNLGRWLSTILCVSFHSIRT